MIGQSKENVADKPCITRFWMMNQSKKEKEGLEVGISADRRLGALRCLIIAIEIRANNHWRNSDWPSTAILLRQVLVLYNLQFLSLRRCNFRCLTRRENLQGRISASYSHSRKAGMQ